MPGLIRKGITGVQLQRGFRASAHTDSTLHTCILIEKQLWTIRIVPQCPRRTLARASQAQGAGVRVEFDPAVGGTFRQWNRLRAGLAFGCQCHHGQSRHRAPVSERHCALPSCWRLP